LDGTNKLNV